MRQPDALNGFQRPGLTVFVALFAVDLGEHHVLQHGAVRQQVEGLEHKTNTLTAQAGTLVVGECRGVDAVNQVIAAGGAVQAADDVEQRGLASAGGAGDRQPVTAFQRQVNVYQRVDDWVGAE